MEKKPTCDTYTPHAFRSLCDTCRNPKIDHQLPGQEEHDQRLAALSVTEDVEYKSNDEYSWIPNVKEPATVEDYFNCLPESKIPKRGTEGEKYRWRQWAIQVPLKDIVKDQCRFMEQEYAPDFDGYTEKLRKKAFDFGFVQLWDKSVPLQCPTCLMLVEEGELVVMSPNTEMSAFHPACFVCSECKELLVDLAHCIDVDGNFYCERHFAQRKMKRCQACDELLFNSRYAQSCDKYYHKEHLLCYNCDENLAGIRAFEKNGELFCDKCYEELFCHDCSKCDRRISVNDKHITFKEDFWHHDCFMCEKCDQSLSGGPFELHDGHYYCCNCYMENFAPRCDGCYKAFDSDSKVLKYQGSTYHIRCFKCADCQRTIGTESFVPRGNLVYCKRCYQKNFSIRCYKCKKPISDEKGITYKKVPYHASCFNCSKCGDSIAGKPFKNIEEKCYCMGCYGEHFCDRCELCKKPILLGAEEDVLYSFNGKKWHHDCFVCSKCQNSLANLPFNLQDDKLVCSNCVTGEVDDSNF